MNLSSPARFGAITILLCAVAWVTFPGPAEAKPVPASIQYSAQPGQVGGVLISLHGGGWVGGRDLGSIRRKMRPFVQPALTAGWDVVHVSYSSGVAKALADIHQVYLRIRRMYRGTVPVCLLGNSAGGHLALTYSGMTSRMRGVQPVSCVVASSSPTDIVAYRWEVAMKPRARKRKLARFLDIGFRSVRQMFDLSPVRFVSGYETDTLLFTVPGDPLVSKSQVVSFSMKLKRHRRNLYNREVVLPAGNLPFVHHGISATGWFIYREQVRKLLRLA